MINTLVPNLFQTAASGMALVGLDGRWLQTNRSICDMLGYTEAEMGAQHLNGMTPEIDLAEYKAAVDQLTRGERENCHCHQRIRRSDGRLIWISLHISLVRDSNGEPHSLFAQFQDITAQKEAEEVRERMFSLPVALHYVAGFDGYFKKLSPAWSEVLGFPIAYLLSIPYLDLIHPDDRVNTIAEAQRVAECANTFLFENRYRHADGSYRWILWTSFTAPTDGLIYGVALDYTIRKEAEIRLAQTVQELERVLGDLHASNEQIEKLRAGLIKVCAWTKRIQHEGQWMPIDEFLVTHLQLKLTHGISEEAVEAMREENKKLTEEQ